MLVLRLDPASIKPNKQKQRHKISTKRNRHRVLSIQKNRDFGLSNSPPLAPHDFTQQFSHSYENEPRIYIKFKTNKQTKCQV